MEYMKTMRTQNNIIRMYQKIIKIDLGLKYRFSKLFELRSGCNYFITYLYENLYDQNLNEYNVFDNSKITQDKSFYMGFGLFFKENIVLDFFFYSIDDIAVQGSYYF